MLVILYDEHGGFYDHVQPPATTASDHHLDEFAFNQLGVRVPALLVSPRFARRVLPTPFDHTSLLHSLQDLWALGPLGARTTQANTFWEGLLPNTRTDTPTMISPPSGVEPLPAPKQKPLNPHQSALLALSHVLESMAGEAAETSAARSRQVLSSAQSQIDAAVDRVEAFIKTVGGAVSGAFRATGEKLAP